MTQNPFKCMFSIIQVTEYLQTEELVRHDYTKHMRPEWGRISPNRGLAAVFQQSKLSKHRSAMSNSNSQVSAAKFHTSGAFHSISPQQHKSLPSLRL